MNCAGCGAAIELVGSRGYFHCRHCGRYQFPEPTTDGVCVLEEPVDANCPICSVALVRALIEGQPVGYCAACRGFLATMPAFATVVRLRRAKYQSGERERAPFDPKELHRKVRCPLCRLTMDTHPYGGGGNAVIDSCHRCKLVWLDARELAIIESYVPHVRQIERPILMAPVAAGVPFGGGHADVIEDSWWPF